jgi:hypothetical protein
MLEGPQAAKTVATEPLTVTDTVSEIVLVAVEVITTPIVNVVVCIAVTVVDASTSTSAVLVTVMVLVTVDVIGKSVVARIWRKVMVSVIVSNTSTSSSHSTELGYSWDKDDVAVYYLGVTAIL